jgi:acyl-CoA hydrolase
MTSPADPQPARVRGDDTRVRLSALMQPADANFMGVIHGGVILKLIDEAAGTCAYRFARRRVVTAAIDRTAFHHPVQIGNLVTLKACINYAGRTSMEVGVRVEAEDLDSGLVIHTNSAYLVFVAVDDAGRPTAVPALAVDSPDEKRRWAAAKRRQETRLAELAAEPDD